MLDIDIEPGGRRVFMLVNDESFRSQNIYSFKSDLTAPSSLRFPLDDFGQFEQVKLLDSGYLVSGNDIGVKFVSTRGDITDAYDNSQNQLRQLSLFNLAASDSHFSYHYTSAQNAAEMIQVLDHQFNPVAGFAVPDLNRIKLIEQYQAFNAFSSSKLQRLILDEEANHYFVLRLFADEAKSSWLDVIVKTDVQGEILTVAFPKLRTSISDPLATIQDKTSIADLKLLPDRNNRLLVLLEDDYDGSQGTWTTQSIAELVNDAEISERASTTFILPGVENIRLLAAASIDGERYVGFQVEDSLESGIARLVESEGIIEIQGQLTSSSAPLSRQFGPGTFLAATDNDFLLSNIQLSEAGNGLSAYTAGTVFGEAEGFWTDNFGAGTQLNRFSLRDNKLLALGGRSLFVYDQQLRRIQRFDRQELQSAQAKAIIVAGAGTSDSLWPATFSNANLAYDALIAQGFSKDRIFYLSHENIDLDNNGNDQDDVDGRTTKANMRDAIVNWASDADDVVIYMVDHGDDGSFILDRNALVSADEMATWVGQLDRAIPGNITIVYDACLSGSFIPFLEGDNRRIFTSSAADQTAYFYGQGDISFSSFFWQSVANGKDLATAFTNATNSLSFASEAQTPQVNVNGADLLEVGNLNVLSTVRIGSGNEYDQAIPTINTQVTSVSASDGVATIEITDVLDEDGEIGRVWGIVEPPGYEADPTQPVTDLPTIEFTRSSGNTYQGTWDGFTRVGLYRVSIYARDRQGNTSPAITTTVTVEDALPSIAIMVGSVGETVTSSQAIDTRLQVATETLRQRGFGTDDILYLSDLGGGEHYDDENTLDNLRDALTRDLPVSVRDLVVYLAGDGDGDGFYLKGGVVTPAQLAQWLSQAQDKLVVAGDNPAGVLTVVLDTHHAGSWLSPLSLYGESGDSSQGSLSRIVIAGSAPGESAAWLPNGLSRSFGDFFWRQIRENLTVGRAFYQASQRVNGPGILQHAMIDDNGNGVFEPKQDRVDLANGYRIGADISQGSNNPFINRATADLVVPQGGVFTLWVDDVISSAPVTEVTAEIVHPRQPGQEAFSERLVLTDVSEGRYEVEVKGLPSGGEYGVMFLVTNDNGFVSEPVTITVFSTGAEDNAEPDNSQDSAVLIHASGASYSRTLHNEDDRDLFRFYAGYDGNYLIDFERQGEKGLALKVLDDEGELVRQQSGTLSETELTLSAGLYYLEVSRSGEFEVDEGYYRFFVSEDGAERARVSGFVLDHSGDTVRDARLVSSDGVVTQSAGNGFYEMEHATGQFTMAVEYDGTRDETFTLSVPVVGQYNRHLRLSREANNTGQPMVIPFRRVAKAHDYDGDGKADVAVRRRATFFQYVLNSGDNSISDIPFGRNENDIPVSGDFDGDGKADIAVRRPSNRTWYVLNSSDGKIQRVPFGKQQADIPVPADYDGDGITDFAVRRPSDQTWYIRNSSDGEIERIRFGLQADDIPVPADYDGDGKADLAVRRPSDQTWYIRNSSNGEIQRIKFGLQAADIPVSADYDGDGKADLAVRRPSNQTWYIRRSSDRKILGIEFGREATDIPIPADYDGDGKADLAVRRPRKYFQYIRKSTDGGIQRIRFGLNEGDIPLAAPLSTRLNMSDGRSELLGDVSPEQVQRALLSQEAFHVKIATGQD